MKKRNRTVGAGRKLPDKWVLSVFNRMGNRISKRRIGEHYAHNKKAWSAHLQKEDMGRQGYIENQSFLSDMKYGFGTMDKNGCGIIAVYNALQALKEPGSTHAHPVELPELIAYFEGCGGAALGGILGTTPKAIKAYFEKNGYEVTNGFSQNRKVCISLYYNKENRLFSGMHYVCAVGGTAEMRYSCEINGGGDGKKPVWVLGIR